jgi:hypothetical protein
MGVKVEADGLDVLYWLPKLLGFPRVIIQTPLTKHPRDLAEPELNITDDAN